VAESGGGRLPSCRRTRSGDGGNGAAFSAIRRTSYASPPLCWRAWRALARLHHRATRFNTSMPGSRRRVGGELGALGENRGACARRWRRAPVGIGGETEKAWSAVLLPYTPACLRRACCFAYCWRIALAAAVPAGRSAWSRDSLLLLSPSLLYLGEHRRGAAARRTRSPCHSRYYRYTALQYITFATQAAGCSRTACCASSRRACRGRHRMLSRG